MLRPLICWRFVRAAERRGDEIANEQMQGSPIALLRQIGSVSKAAPRR